MTQDQLNQALLEAAEIPLPLRIAKALLQEHSYDRAVTMLQPEAVSAHVPAPMVNAVQNALRDLHRPVVQAKRTDAEQNRLAVLGFSIRKFLPDAPAGRTRHDAAALPDDKPRPKQPR
jgi:hypothetical protein